MCGIPTKVRLGLQYLQLFCRDMERNSGGEHNMAAQQHGDTARRFWGVVVQQGEYWERLGGNRKSNIETENSDGQDAGLGGTLFGALPGLGKRQRLLLCLLFRRSCLLTICVQGKWGVYYGLQWGCWCSGNGDGWDPGLGWRAFSRIRPALVNANISFYVFLFVVLVC